MDYQMHHLLTSLPLLQGIGATDVAQILDSGGYRLSTLEEGACTIRQGDTCQQLSLLTDGTLRAETHSTDGCYSYTEDLVAPWAIEPDVLYGIQRQYGHTYVAKTTCNLLTIAKNDVNCMMRDIEVFRFNFLNQLSTLAIRRQYAIYPMRGTTLNTRLARFFCSHSLQSAGHMHFEIRISDIAGYLGISRMVVSAALHEMADQGLLHLGRGTIDIPSIEQLTTHATI